MTLNANVVACQGIEKLSMQAASSSHHTLCSFHALLPTVKKEQTIQLMNGTKRTDQLPDQQMVIALGWLVADRSCRPDWPAHVDATFAISWRHWFVSM